MSDTTQSILSIRIDEAIMPLITSDYVLWGLPYYINPGDTLIWQGTLDFLKECKYRCLGTCGWDEYRHIPLRKDTVILILGGGYFGDVWRNAWNSVMETITEYPDNPIILLPQSIYYENQDLAMKDSSSLSKCRNLTICARDDSSYEFASGIFNNRVILVPDMAFHINTEDLKRWCVKSTGRDLLLRRNDKELTGIGDNLIGRDRIDCSDWPLMESSLPVELGIVYRIYRLLKKVGSRLAFDLEQKLMLHCQKRTILKESVRFISSYDTIYSTRLHAMILAFLLGKDIRIIDNSYGKISACYRTWLSGCDSINMY